MNIPRAFWTAQDGRPCAFFKDHDPVRLRVVPPDGAGTIATFVITARHARGRWTLWRWVVVLRWVAADADGGFTAEWKLADGDSLHRWAFAEFRFDAMIRVRGVTRRLRSDVLRHHANTVGFYGFGPVGERWSNAEVRRIAREVGGVAIRARKPWALRRLARQVPPDARGLRLFGYSLGGRAAWRLARWLDRRGIGVELLVGIDPVDLAARTLVVPSNVRRAVSFYQRNGARLRLLAGPAGRGLTFTATGADTAVENCCVDDRRVGEGRWPIAHEDMPRVLKAEVIGLLRDEAAHHEAPPAAPVSRVFSGTT